MTQSLKDGPKNLKKYGHVATCLDFDFCSHEPTYMALQGQKLQMTQKVFSINLRDHG